MNCLIMAQREREAMELEGFTLQVTQQKGRKYIRDPDKDIFNIFL